MVVGNIPKPERLPTTIKNGTLSNEAIVDLIHDERVKLNRSPETPV